MRLKQPPWIGFFNCSLEGGSIQTKMMRPIGIIFVNRAIEFEAHSSYRVSQQAGLSIELFAEDLVSSFNTAIVQTSFGRKNKKLNAQLISGLLKVSHTLRSPIDLE